MYKTLHKKQGSVTVQLRFARSSVTFCAKRDIYLEGKNHIPKDMEFHEAIAKCSGNRVFEVLVPIIYTAVTTFANLTNRQLMKETIETHRAITDAILRGDSMGAKCAMIMHLTYNRQKLLELIEQREKSSDKLTP